MNRPIMPSIESIESAQNRLWRTVAGARNDSLPEVVGMILHNRLFLKALTAFVAGYKPLSISDAREIMGTNFFGIEEAMRYFRIHPTDEEMSYMSVLPFTESELVERKDTHILVAEFPTSIIDIKKIHPGSFFRYDMYDEEKWMLSTGMLGWNLVRKRPTPESLGQSINALCSTRSNEYIPTAQLAVYTVVGHALATGELLLEDLFTYAHTTSGNGYKLIGRVGQKGIIFHSVEDSERTVNSAGLIGTVLFSR